MITFEKTEDASRWNAACRTSGQPVTPFHTHTFLRLLAPMIGNRFTPLVVRHAGRDVGVVPWLTVRLGPVTIVNRAPLPYIGPLVPDELLVPVLRALRRRARSARTVVEEHQFPPGVHIDDAAAAGCGFELSTDRTFVLDTTRSEPDLLAAMTTRTRANIRKAERTGITIAQSPTADRTLAAIEAAIYARKDLRSPYAPPFPPTAAEINRNGLEAHWSVASDGAGDAVATLLTLGFGTTTGIWVGGVLPEHRSSAANIALVWDAIRWAHRRGVDTFDFVGLPNPGIEAFKKQFGGELRTYPVLRRFAPGWRAMQRLAQRAGSSRTGPKS